MNPKLLIILALAAAALFVVFRPTTTASRWINLYDECFDSPTFGQFIARDTPLYTDRARTEVSGTVEHGKPAQVLSGGDPTRVRVGNLEGYIGASLLSAYDPKGGAEFDPTACVAS